MNTTSLPLAWLDLPADVSLGAVPALARERHADAAATVLSSATAGPQGPLHWLRSRHASGWVQRARTAPLDPARLGHDFSALRERGFTGADAALLVIAAQDGALPRLSWDEAPEFAPAGAAPARSLGLYALVDSAERLARVLDSGLHTVQVRIKTPARPDAAWQADLRKQLACSIALAREAGAELFVNDHLALALELGASAVHLGQEDLQALGAEGRARLRAAGLALGVSSHSVWELCRARTLSPRYIACGPVWPTTTKDMPWIAQGLDNLAWWAAHAGAPVVGIGGILSPDQVEQAASCGVDGVCIVRGLGDDPAAVLPGLRAALERGKRAFTPAAVPALPHPMLPAEVAG